MDACWRNWQSLTWPFVQFIHPYLKIAALPDCVSASCQLDPAYNTWEESRSERRSVSCCDIDFSVGDCIDQASWYGKPHPTAGVPILMQELLNCLRPQKASWAQKSQPARLHFSLHWALDMLWLAVRSSCLGSPHDDGREPGTGSWNEPLSSVSFLFLRVLSRSDRNETGTLAWWINRSRAPSPRTVIVCRSSLGNARHF